MLNSTHFAAMREPLLVDTKGRLLGLRSDGVTVLVDSRTVFRDAGTNGRFSWTASHSGVAILRSDGWRWSHRFSAPDARPAMEPPTGLPVAFSVSGPEQWALIWSNGLNSHCLTLSGDDVFMTACPNFRACDGQWSDGVLELVGLQPRSEKSEGGRRIVSALGIGQYRQIFRVGMDGASQRHRELVHDSFTKDCRQLDRGSRQDFPSQPYPESIVAILGKSLVAQYTVPNLLMSDDADLLDLEPRANDAEGLAVCLTDERLSVQSVHHGLAYAGSRIVADSFKYIYGIQKRDSWDGLRNDNIVRISLADGSSDLYCEPVRINSLPSGQVFAEGRFGLMPSVGYVGSLETTDPIDRSQRKSWLVRSDDGLHWNVIHEIS